MKFCSIGDVRLYLFRSLILAGSIGAIVDKGAAAELEPVYHNIRSILTQSQASDRDIPLGILNSASRNLPGMTQSIAAQQSANLYPLYCKKTPSSDTINSIRKQWFRASQGDLLAGAYEDVVAKDLLLDRLYSDFFCQKFIKTINIRRLLNITPDTDASALSEKEIKAALLISPRDYPKNLISHVQNQAQLGKPAAQYLLGYMHDRGLGMEKDLLLAAEFYRKGGEQDYANAQNNLGIMYCKLNQILKAMECFSLAADQGYARAQNNLGLIYINGYGVDRDCLKAREYFQKAAAQGAADAYYNLGWLYFNCCSMQDYKEAEQCFLVAADLGSGMAQFQLAEMYYKGRVVEFDFMKAKKYLHMADDQGNVEAGKKLARMKQIDDKCTLF